MRRPGTPASLGSTQHTRIPSCTKAKEVGVIFSLWNQSADECFRSCIWLVGQRRNSIYCKSVSAAPSMKWERLRRWRRRNLAVTVSDGESFVSILLTVTWRVFRSRLKDVVGMYIPSDTLSYTNVHKICYYWLVGTVSYWYGGYTIPLLRTKHFFPLLRFFLLLWRRSQSKLAGCDKSNDTNALTTLTPTTSYDQKHNQNTNIHTQAIRKFKSQL